MSDLGHFCLLLGLFLSGYALIVDAFAAARNHSQLARSGRNATFSAFAVLSVAMALLWVLLIRSDFSVSYVAEHTSKALPLAYKISALWAGASGSLLLWLWMQVGLVAIAFRSTDPEKRQFAAGARSLANLVSVYFILVLIFDKNPFELSTTVPADGAGLNPLLQHPAMALHPPTLFIGYAAFAVPFAWALASIRTHGLRGTKTLFSKMQGWILLAWLFLTIGIVLGAWWAYEELGWGGYWAWDPVENASLMPWLTATALLHCSRTFRPDTSIAKWLVGLSILTFGMCIFGTFLTRYGLVSSVHAFPEPGLGILFMVLIVNIIVLAGVLFGLHLANRKTVPQAVSTKAHRSIIINNYLMLLLMVVIFVGTLFPFFSQLLAKRQIQLQPAYFTKITALPGLGLLLLLAICPHLFKRGFKAQWRTIGAIAAVAVAVLAWLVVAVLSQHIETLDEFLRNTGIIMDNPGSQGLAIACGIISLFAVVNLIADFAGLKRRPGLRWLGARLVHIGVVLTFIGIAGSGGYDVEENIALTKDQTKTVAGYDLTFESLEADHGHESPDEEVHSTTVTANIIARKEGGPEIKLGPALAFYTASDKRTSEIAVRRTLAGDLYLALTEVDHRSGMINLMVLIKPLINWIWIGGILAVLGTVAVLISLFGRTTARVKTDEDSK